MSGVGSVGAGNGSSGQLNNVAGNRDGHVFNPESSKKIQALQTLKTNTANPFKELPPSDTMADLSGGRHQPAKPGDSKAGANVKGAFDLAKSIFKG